MSMVSIGGPDLSGLRRSIEKCNMWNSILRVFWQSRKIALFWFRRYVAHEDQTQMGFAFSNLMWMLSEANLQVGDSSFLLLALSAKTKVGSRPKNRLFLCIFDLLYFHRVSSPEAHIYRVARPGPVPTPSKPQGSSPSRSSRSWATKYEKWKMAKIGTKKHHFWTEISKQEANPPK